MTSAIKEEEKRRFPRIRMHNPLSFQIIGSQEICHTISEDVSTGGVGFINNRFIAPETQVTLKINVLSRVLNAIGKIAWAACKPHCDSCRIGIKFTEINTLEQKFLSDYIDLHINKP